MRIPAANELSRENGAAWSCLNLQPVLWGRQDRKRRRFSADHRNFVAAIQSWALITVFMNLVGKVLMIRGNESHTCEKLGNASEQANTAYLVFFGLRQQSFDQQPAATIALARRINGDRTDLGQVYAVEMQSTASDDSSLILQNNEVTDILADLRQRPRQQSSIPGVGRDQGVNLLRIRQHRFTRAHESPCPAKQTPRASARPHPEPWSAGRCASSE